MRRQFLLLSVAILLVTLADGRPLGGVFVDEQSAASLATFDQAPAINAHAGSGDGGDDNALILPFAQDRFGEVTLHFFHAVFLTNAQDTGARTPPARAPPSSLS